MNVDFSAIEDVESFLTIPEGSYLCRIAEVREGLTREGSPRWALRLEVASGEFTGRTAAWDGLVWSERGLPRVKSILGHLGFDVRGAVDVTPADLVDRTIRAQLVTEQREDPITGRRVVRLRVPYMGFAPASAEDSPF